MLRALRARIASRHPTTTGDLAEWTARSPIMVSDDNEGFVRLLQLGFTRSGLSALGVTHPLDTITLCRHTPISLIISDLSKPGMNGLEMLECLYSDPATHHIPVLFLSASYQPSLIERARRLGALGYIPKPVMITELVEVVCHLLITAGNWQMPCEPNPIMAQRLTQANTGTWHGKVFPIRYDAHMETI